MLKRLALPGRARRAVPRRGFLSGEISAVRGGKRFAPSLDWGAAGAISTILLAVSFSGCRVCLFVCASSDGFSSAGGDKYKPRFSSAGLCGVGNGGFTDQPLQSGRALGRGDISAQEQAKTRSVKSPLALCCHNTFG